MKPLNYARPETLVETEWVAQHLQDPSIRLVEVDVDPRLYAAGHLPGAITWNWRTDIQDSLRRNILTPAAFEALMAQSGIAADTTVVLYGDKNNWFAAYAFWQLTYFGHPDIRLMNGGRKKWIAERRPLVRDVPRPQPTTYTIQNLNPDIRALRDQVMADLGRPNVSFIDVRSPKEFSGEMSAPDHLVEEGAMRSGHLPGAVNITWGQTVRADGTFKSAAELRQLYASHGITPEADVTVYCRIGERSSHTWYVLHFLLGYPNVRNYDGSWAEWGNLIDAPIER